MGAGGLQHRPLVPAAVHGDHRRAGLDHGLLLRRPFIVLLPLFLNQLPAWLGFSISTALASHLETMIFGALIVFFLMWSRTASRGCETRHRGAHKGDRHETQIARSDRRPGGRHPRRRARAIRGRCAGQEQFFPLLVYRTGPYAPNGTPWANGKQDYIKLVNANGGINGVKIAYEECETGYATDKGVECYERLKGRPASRCSTRRPPASPSR
ncbi:periplasmic binding protein domain-containing protein [Ditylenchus destructor]|uniref:Periplasmic binding protein domain-containing protein n=1 Tax=Ditylenchus destructor TaxID=166010 RepID=A0AAD4MIE9_9BILA|nr:periplasmic binding protein domain-containing protein [Ditylenchus destructor]